MKTPVVMVIDDSAYIRDTVASMLKHVYNVAPFTSGYSALEYLRNHTVELILLDYEMPDMAGYEVLLELQLADRTRTIPVILLTDVMNEQIESKLVAYGALNYITKPFSASSLIARIRAQLELKEYRSNMERLINEKTEELRYAYDRLKRQNELTISLLAQITNMRDHGTGDHIHRTTELVRIIVEDLLVHSCPGYTLTSQDAENIVESSRLHDVGKIGVPDSILQKPGPLTSEEFSVIKTHTTHGAHLFDLLIQNTGNDPFFIIAKDIALYHHEKWNGEGYPTKCKAEATPLAARIVAIADVYDAIRSIRPYKKPMSHEHAEEIILSGSGHHFDPYIVEVFMRHKSEYKAIAYSV